MLSFINIIIPLIFFSCLLFLYHISIEPNSKKIDEPYNSSYSHEPYNPLIGQILGYVIHDKNSSVPNQVYVLLEDRLKKLKMGTNNINKTIEIIKKTKSMPYINRNSLLEYEKNFILHNCFYFSLFKPYFFLQKQCFEPLLMITNAMYSKDSINKKKNFYMHSLKNGERLKAIAILLKRISTISGPESNEERIIALNYISSFKQKKAFNEKDAKLLKQIYMSFDSEIAYRLSYPSIDFTQYLSINDRIILLDVMFKIANATDGIIYGELSFLCTYAYFSGIPELTFKKYCQKYNVTWSWKYVCEESPFGYKQHGKSFINLHKNLWINLSTTNTKNNQKKKTEYKKKNKNTYNEENYYSYEQQKNSHEQQKTSSASNSYYALLNLSKDVSNEEVKKAYRKMAMKYHPDRLPVGSSEKEIKQANEMFIQIQRAYEYICKERNM